MTTVATTWGPLAEPIHSDAAGPGDPVWKDNAYLSFWDVAGGVFGSVHVSTSPNGEGARRARCSVSGHGVVVEVVEDLEPGTFSSDSIHFDLDGTVRVDHPTLQAELTYLPLYAPADYAVTGLIPELVPGKPLQHFQQGCTVTGTVTVGGSTYNLDAEGMRDRTWGFRDEVAQWVEYAGLIATFEGAFITAIKFVSRTGEVAGDGFFATAEGVQVIERIHFRRDAAARFIRATLELADGSTRTVSITARETGFWVPMGAESDGPAFGTYDDFMQLDLDGAPGAGLFEQGIIHRAA
ncbi:MAG TPA: hypothetical protein VLI04_16110 [Nocardioidaceae bacterium]|nr:hypothetical protein [Nocardioidaceae bacterium]